MRALKEIGMGFTAYAKSISFINTHRLWRYILIPAFINLLIFIALGILIWNYTGIIDEWLTDKLGADTVKGTFGEILEWLIAAIVKIISFLIYFKFYRYTVLLLSAPVLAFIAEKTQEILTGTSHPFQLKQLTHDIVRGLGITLKNLFLELILTLPLYLLSLIPLLTPFTGILILCVESYFVGFSMIDYRNEFKRLSASQSRHLINRHKGLAIGNGLAFNLLLIIPLIGVLFAPALGVVAAGLATQQVFDNYKLQITNYKSPE